MRVRSKVIGNEKGAAAVEFALIAPLLILLLFGLIEFGRVWSARNVYTSAAREGARVVAVGGTVAAARTRVQGASTPYAEPATSSISIIVEGGTVGDPPCQGNEGKPVSVFWTQAFELNIAFFSWTADDGYDVRSVFQCE